MKQFSSYEQPSLQVLARSQKDDNQEQAALGLDRTNQKTRIRINGKDVKQVSELSSLLPVQIINPDVHKLLEEGPKFRREFMDWGVFHVEHSFYPAWKRYQRSLKQRNTALRARNRNDTDIAWDHELIEAGKEIHILRKRYIEDLKQILPRYLKPIFGEIPVEIQYYPGWPEDKGDFGQILKEMRSKDRDQGFTGYGPHRADLLIKIEGKSAAERVSRGQQ